jgi:hypothetical protein
MTRQDNYISDNSSKAKDESRSKRKFPGSSERKSWAAEVEATTSDCLYVPSPPSNVRSLEGGSRDGVVDQRDWSPYAAPLFRVGTNISNSIEGKFIRTVL